MTNVVYLPGLLGSNLSYSPPFGGPLQTVWIDPTAVFQGQLQYLQLAADGLSPGPLCQGRAVAPTGILRPAYGELSAVMQAFGWKVLEIAFDWRKSVLVAAADALPIIQAYFGPAPFWLVAHSQGGLVSRAIYRLMQQSGLDAQLAGLLTLCTPHFGSFAIVRLFFHLPPLYRLLIHAIRWAAWIAGTPGPAYLDGVLASMPALYELLPFAASGPLFSADPNQAAALYQTPTYFGGNPYLTEALFTRAKTTQAILSGFLPAGRTHEIVGTNKQTAYSLPDQSKGTSNSGYLYTQLGDGVVTVAESALPGVTMWPVEIGHEFACLDPAVWSLVYGIVSGALT